MFKFLAIVAFVAAATAHFIPSSEYHFTIHHPAHYEKYEEPAAVEAPKPAEEAQVEEAVTAEEQKEEENQESEEQKEEEHGPANYEFAYEVHDEKTGDIKRHSESAVEGVVKGQYSLIDSDGFRRIVEYTADKIHGFQATVRREPTHYKIPEPIKNVEEETEESEML